MNQLWLIYSAITAAYIIILVIYFLRRTRFHEHELNKVLDQATQQLEKHQQEVQRQASLKVKQALAIIQKLQDVAEDFEETAKEEYDRILEDAREQKRDLIAEAKKDAEEIVAKAEEEIDEYKRQRHREIEKNLVKMVINITQRVVEMSLSETDHQALILKALEEVKQKKDRS